MPYWEAIPDALWGDPTLGGTVSTIGTISSTGLIALNYNGVETVAFRYTLQNVKIETAIT